MLRSIVTRWPIIIAALIGLSSASAVSELGYPAAVQGIWFSDDNNGRRQCRSFQTAVQNRKEDAAELLVGSEVIHRALWHSYAEYGEGNFYKLKRSDRTGKASWQFEAQVGIDSYPDGSEAEVVTFRVKINNGKMVWIMEPSKSQDAPSSKNQQFFRCRPGSKSFFVRMQS